MALSLLAQHPDLTHLTMAMLGRGAGAGKETGCLLSDERIQQMKALPSNKTYIEKTPMHALYIDQTEGQIIAMIRDPDDAIASAIAAPFMKRSTEEFEKLYVKIYKNLLKYKDRIIFIDYKRIVNDINHIQEVFIGCNLKRHKVKLITTPPIIGFYNKKKPYKASDTASSYYKRCRKLCLK